MVKHLLVLMNLLALQAGASWQRHVMTPKEERFDQPEPHPLAYFTEHPMLRDESGDFCPLCSPDKRLAEAKKQKVASELRSVGTLGGLEVYDLFYRFKCEGCVDWKSILVKTGPDEYREIYHREPTQVDAHAGPSFIVNVRQDKLLGARYMVGGNKGEYEDDYYWFDKNGPVLVDFGPVRVAARSVLPKGRNLWGGGDDNGPRTMALAMFKFWVLDKDNWGRGGGAVEVRFRLDQGRVIVTGTKYDPKANPWPENRKQ
jgi:hypothetical protein